MTTVIFESHAASVDTEPGVASGHRDVPLSSQGEQEAHALGERYAASRIDVVYCSDLRRSYETAELAFAARGIPIVRDRRLREQDYGESTGRMRREIGAERPRRLTEPFPGGESVAQAVERVRLFLRDVATRHTGETLLVIGHSATHFGLEHWINGTPLQEIVAAPWTYEPGRPYVLTEDALRRIEGTAQGGHRD